MEAPVPDVPVPEHPGPLSEPPASKRASSMDVPDPVPATSSVSADHPSSGNRTPRDSPVKKEKKPKLETKPVQVIKSELKQQKTSDLKAKKPSVPDASAACGAPQVDVKKQEKCAAKKEFPAKVKLETAKVKLERGLTTPTKQSPETPKATQRKEKRRFDKVDKVIATGTDLGQVFCWIIHFVYFLLVLLFWSSGSQDTCHRPSMPRMLPKTGSTWMRWICQL